MRGDVATLEAKKFQGYFEGATLVKGSWENAPRGNLLHARARTDYLEAAIRTVVQIHRCEPPGDVLLFLTARRIKRRGRLEPD